MKTKEVPSTWVQRAGLRLDCGPYLSGSIEAQVIMERASFAKDPLSSVTTGYNGGIYNGPMFRRNFVEAPEYGVPFLTSSTMLKADLSHVPLLRKEDALSPRLSYLKLRAGTSMISCSGTVGRMVYARPDMDGMWTCQDILKAVADNDKIRSGYLYAFLSSKFGIPLVTSGTYGAIIQHIEPEHIADLPVPRLGTQVEQKAHKLVEKAAQLRAQASASIAAAISKLEQLAKLPELPRSFSPIPHGLSEASVTHLRARFDAFFHSEYHEKARKAILNCACKSKNIADFADSIVEPTRFKRRQVEDEEYGIPFFGTTALFWSEPVASYLIPKMQPGVEQYIVHKESLLIPRSGQLSGIIGQVVLPHGAVVGAAVTEDAIRVNCPDEETAGYLFIALSSEYGVRQLKARAYGSSIPHLDVNQIGAVVVPNLQAKWRSQLGELGIHAGKQRDEAIGLEQEARSLVEDAIERAAK